jgi:hypothetical protein
MQIRWTKNSDNLVGVGRMRNTEEEEEKRGKLYKGKEMNRER